MDTAGTTPEAQLTRMREMCEAAIGLPGGDTFVITAALTYRRVLSSNDGGAAQVVARVKSAVADIRLNAHALPQNTPERFMCDFVAQFGQDLLDGTLTSKLS